MTRASATQFGASRQSKEEAALSQHSSRVCRKGFSEESLMHYLFFHMQAVQTPQYLYNYSYMVALC